MSGRDFEIDAERYVVVQASDVVDVLDERDAARRLMQLLETRGDFQALREAVQERRALPPLATAGDIFGLAAKMLATGTLRLVRVPEERGLMDEPEVVNLSDLGEIEPLEPIVPGSGRGSGPGAAEPTAPGPVVSDEVTFVHFEVVDEAGRPVVCDYACTIDGAAHDGVHEDERVRFDELAPATQSAVLTLEGLRFEDGPSIGDEPLDGPAPGPPGTGIDGPITEPETAPLAFELVDDEGEPLSDSTFVLELSDGRSVEGTTDGDGRYELPDAPTGAEHRLRLFE